MISAAFLASTTSSSGLSGVSGIPVGNTQMPLLLPSPILPELRLLQCLRKIVSDCPWLVGFSISQADSSGAWPASLTESLTESFHDVFTLLTELTGPVQIATGTWNLQQVAQRTKTRILIFVGPCTWHVNNRRHRLTNIAYSLGVNSYIYCLIPPPGTN